jgi:O-acetyl-ADP-ribose deacetylase (regulator of RNase III)
MKIKYINDNIFNFHGRFIAHGCNARGVMGSGVAKAIKQRYPYAYREYRHSYETKGLSLGEVQVVKCRDRTIINMILQENFGRDGKRYVSYDAVVNAMVTLEEILYGEEIAFPMIGSGLGGGNWNIIESIIENELKTVQPYIYYLK